MPRRGGRDRLRLRTNRQSLLEVAERERLHAPPAEVNQQRAAIREAKTHANGKPGLPCTHGTVPWTVCTICSKPRSR